MGAQFGLEVLYRVEGADGGWHYEWEGDKVAPEPEWVGSVLWRYDGQQTFYTGANTEDGFMRFNTADGPANRWDAVAQVSESIRIDSRGRRWVVDYFDESMLETALEDYAGRIRLEGFELDGDPLQRYWELLEEQPLEEPEEFFGEYNDWSMTLSQVDDCTRMTYGTDDNTSLSDPMTAVGNLPAVLIGLETGSCSGCTLQYDDHSCGGVLVAHEWVLTAAHCGTAGTYLGGSYNSAGAFKVCSHGNSHSSADCVGVEEIITNSSFLTWGGAANDYLLLHLDGPLNTGALGWLPISSGSNSTIEGFNSVVTGYPGWIPGTTVCDSNEDTTEQLSPGSPEWGMNNAYNPTWDSTPLIDMTSTLHKNANDLGKGFSRSAFRYNPSGNNWYITGIDSAQSYCCFPPSVTGAHVGANHDQFRSWVASHI